jgi:hypothetical protein
MVLGSGELARSLMRRQRVDDYARIIVQLSIVAVAAYVVTDTSAILAVLLDEPEREAVVDPETTSCAPSRTSALSAARVDVRQRIGSPAWGR